MNSFHWLEKFSNYLTYAVFSLEPETHLADSVEFFFNDIFKIFLLLLLVTHLMGFIRYYFPMEKVRKFLVTYKFYGLDYFLATIFGAITPFCSCSSIPLFIGFIQARIPLGVTLAFLITSPLINEVAIALFLSIFGLKVTLAYLFSGILVGMIGGFILGKMKLEKYLDDYFQEIKARSEKQKTSKKISCSVFREISQEAFSVIKKIGVYVLIGVALGAFVHGFVPQGFFEEILEKAGWLGVPLAVILAVPLYSNASGVIPIIKALIVKGVPIGTALAFMMAIVGISLPEALILKRIFKWQLLASFFGVVTIGIIIIGYLFNIFL
jgi:uncharacterized membrane protein YraQ (UPF0718 family)